MPPVPHTHPPLLTLVFSAAVMALTVSYAVEASSSDAARVEQGAGKAPYEPPTLAASAVVLNKVAAYRVDQGVVKFFFASGKSQLVQGADQALQDIVAAVQTGRRVQISGFTMPREMRHRTLSWPSSAPWRYKRSCSNWACLRPASCCKSLPSLSSSAAMPRHAEWK